MDTLILAPYRVLMVTYTDPQHVSAPAPQAANPEPTKVLKAIAKRSFATLSTTSPAHRPHVAGVLYEAVGTTMYVNTLGISRKARNVAANPQVAVAIPIRRLPAGPPSTVHFQGTADVLDVDDPEIRALIVVRPPQVDHRPRRAGYP